MKRFLKHILITISLFLVICYVLSTGSLWSLQKASFYKPGFLSNAVVQEDFDYIVLGASTGLTTLNTKAIDAQIGSEGLNLSMDDTGLSSQYIMLQHFLAEGKTTKFCVLAPGVGAFDAKATRINDNDYRFLMFINRPYVSRYFLEVKEKDTQSRVLSSSQWFPFLGVSYYNAEIFYPSLIALMQPNKRNRFDDKGNYTYPVSSKKLKPMSKKAKAISFSNPYLAKIKKLCDQNDIDLIYYISPLRSQKLQLKDQGKEVMVINHSSIITDDTQFYDDIHVNSKGRKITSRIFAQQLAPNLK